MVKCNYYNKNYHVALFCFYRKKNESKNMTRSSYLNDQFYKQYHENKTKNKTPSSYLNHHDYSLKPITNMHSTNARGSKKIWGTECQKFKL